MFTYREFRNVTEQGFYALASSNELDEIERSRGNYEHPEFSFILHFADGHGRIVARFTSRIEDFAVIETGAIYAVGAFVPGVIVIEAGAFHLDRIADARSLAAIQLDADRVLVAGESRRGHPLVAIRSGGEWQTTEAQGQPFEYVYGCSILSAAGEPVVIRVTGQRAGPVQDGSFAVDGLALVEVADDGAPVSRLAVMVDDAWPIADGPDYVDVPSDQIGLNRAS